MLVGELPSAELELCLRGNGLHLTTGAFTTHLTIDVAPLVDEFAAMYADYPIEEPAGIDDFAVRIGSPSLLWLAPLRMNLAYRPLLPSA